LHAIDVSDPAAPREAGVYPAGQGISDLAASGDTVYVAKTHRGLYVLKAVPVAGSVAFVPSAIVVRR
jgi:hypothetical protein